MKLDKLDDMLNPVLVKELRQFFHNKVLLVLMSLLMSGELLQLFIIAMRYPHLHESSKANIGLVSYIIQAAAIGVCSVLQCGIINCNYFNKERMNKDLDYSRITVLTPLSIVTGKFLGNLLVILFIHAVCLPFMVVSYFLRGISIPDMAIWLLGLLPLYLLISQFGLLFGSIGKKGAEVPLGIVLWLGIPVLIGFIVENVHNASQEMYAWVLLECLIVTALIMIFTACTASISSIKSNVAFWPRVAVATLIPGYPLILFLVSLILNLFTPPGTPFSHLFKSNAHDYVLGEWENSISIVFLVLIILLLAILTMERSSPGIRVMEERPKNKLPRFFFMLFSSGQAGGLLLSWILTSVFSLVIMYITGDNFSFKICASAFYFLFYAHVAILLERLFLHKRKAVSAILVLLLLLILPCLLCGFLSMDNTKPDIGYLTTTPFLLADCPEDYWYFPVAFAFISGLCLLPFVFHETKLFLAADKNVTAQE